MRRGSGRVLPLVVGTLGLLGCGALIMALTYRYNVRLDLTTDRSYTLSTHATRILRALDRDVRVTVFARSEDPRTPLVKDLLWRVTRETARVRYELVDLNRSPALARRYGVDRYGALVLESGKRRRDISNPTEGLLMSAILAVTRDEERVVYFVTGHGERSPRNADRRTGYSSAARALEDELFVVRELALIGPEGLPADATVVVLAGPRKDLVPGELEHLESYLARGGSLLLLLDPESPPSLAALAGRSGVTPLEATVIDPTARLAAGEGQTFRVSGLSPTFLVSRTLEAAPVFSAARPLRVEPHAAATAIGFLETSPASYGVAPGRDLQAARSGAGGSFTVGVALLPSPADAPPSARRGGRLIVLGDSDFATNALIEYLGNRDLFVNSVNWLAREESLIAARAHQKAPGREQLFVTQAQGAMAFWLAAVAQPALFLTAGVVALLRRRRR